LRAIASAWHEGSPQNFGGQAERWGPEGGTFGNVPHHSDQLLERLIELSLYPEENLK